MSQRIRSIKKVKRKRVFIGIIITMAIYIITNIISTIGGASKATVLPDHYTLYDKIPAKAIIIKDETVYKSEGSGQLNLLINEGERVPVGIEVANISLLNDNSQIKQELLELNQRIEVLSKGEQNSKENENQLLPVNNELIEKIQSNVNDDNFLNIHNDKEEIKTYKNYISSDTNLLSQSLESLKARRDNLNNQINKNNLKYFSSISGIVSYDIDGYEEILVPNEFENYTYDKLIFEEDSTTKEKSKDNEIIAGSPIFKIINNFEWYMAIKVEDIKDVSEYEIGQTILFELDNDKELNGKIIAKNITNNKVVIVVRLTSYLHNDYNLRFNNVEIVKSKKEGFEILTSTIINNSGRKGVYIKEINGIVKFRPILILGEIGEYTIINKGNHNGYIEIPGLENPVRTVTLYDEIFLYPNNVSEGEILK